MFQQHFRVARAEKKRSECVSPSPMFELRNPLLSGIFVVRMFAKTFA